MRADTAAIMDAIPASAAFTDAHRMEAVRLIEACCVAVEGGFHTPDLAQDLARACVDYGPRLDVIRQAIRSAPLDPVRQAGILGAFGMATIIVFNEADRRGLKKANFRR